MKAAAIVTKDSLKRMLDEATFDRQVHIVGRALVALFNRQTPTEQRADSTDQNNTVGFAGCDALSGSLTAKSYIRSRTLASWQVEKWTRPSGKNGYPRICKYARQLNEIALEKQQAKQGNQLPLV